MTCRLCGGRGAIRVQYESGEPFDLALCSCSLGLNFRKFSDGFLRDAFHLAPDHRIGFLEHFSDEAASVPDFTAAGREPTPRAKL